MGWKSISNESVNTFNERLKQNDSSLDVLVLRGIKNN